MRCRAQGALDVRPVLAAASACPFIKEVVVRENCTRVWLGRAEGQAGGPAVVLVSKRSDVPRTLAVTQCCPRAHVFLCTGVGSSSSLRQSRIRSSRGASHVV